MKQNLSNLAIKQPLFHPVEKQKAKKVKKVKSLAMTPGEKLLYLASILICVSVALTILSRYCLVAELNVNISKIEKEILQLKKENQYLELKKRNLESVDHIRMFAESKGLELKSPEMLPIER